MTEAIHVLGPVTSALCKRRFWIFAGLVLFSSLIVTAYKLNRASAHIAFMGDSITESWSFPRTNLGIHGQTTAQMLSRFNTQIAGKGYKSVVILGGTNDLLLGVDPNVTINNLNHMLDSAVSTGAQPILATIPPIDPPSRANPRSVNLLNNRIVHLAAARHIPLLDYHTALDNEEDVHSADGIHMRNRGYLRMEYALVKVTDPF